MQCTQKLWLHASGTKEKLVAQLNDCIIVRKCKIESRTATIAPYFLWLENM